MKNLIIRDKAKECGVKLWEVAEELGVSDQKLSVLLRHEFDEDMRGRVLDIIERIAERKD